VTNALLLLTATVKNYNEVPCNMPEYTPGYSLAWARTNQNPDPNYNPSPLKVTVLVEESCFAFHAALHSVTSLNPSKMLKIKRLLCAAFITGDRHWQ